MRLGNLVVEIGLKGMEAVRAGIKNLRGDLTDVAETAERSGQRTADAFTNPLHKIHDLGGRVLSTTAAFSALGGIVGGVFAGGAVEASRSYTDLNARLEAITGSTETAARKLAFAQNVAGPSNFSFSQLANATTTLEAFGINAERALPTLAKLGMAFGADSERLDMLTRALGDMASGSFPEKDVMSAFGLNRSMFAAEGIKFDGSGALLSSATDTMTALERIVTTRYGAIFDKVAATPGAKLASLGDSWEKLERVFGDNILSRAAPTIEFATTLTSALAGSGVMADVLKKQGDDLGTMFNNLTRPLFAVTGMLDGVMGRAQGTEAAFFGMRNEMWAAANAVADGSAAMGEASVFALSPMQEGMTKILSLALAFGANLPGVLMRGWSFIGSSFGVLVNNIGAYWDYGMAYIKAGTNNVAEFIGQRLAWAGGVIGTIGRDIAAIGSFIGDSVMVALRNMDRLLGAVSGAGSAGGAGREGGTNPVRGGLIGDTLGIPIDRAIDLLVPRALKRFGEGVASRLGATNLEGARMWPHLERPNSFIEDASRFKQMPQWADYAKRLQAFPELPDLSLTTGAADFYERLKAGMAQAATDSAKGVPDAIGKFLNNADMSGKDDAGAADKSPFGRMAGVSTGGGAGTTAGGELSFRRQALGGGTMAQIGVTAAELFGGNGNGKAQRLAGMHRGAAAAGVPSGTYSGLAAIFEDAVQREVQKQLAKAAGAGYRPR